jgi:hypothetical protein
MVQEVDEINNPLNISIDEGKQFLFNMKSRKKNKNIDGFLSE